MNNNVVTIHQPDHLPWLGFFHKVSRADVLVILDTVQFKKNNFQNRNKIFSYSNDGWSWLGISVLTKGHVDTKIKDIKVNPNITNWKSKYLKTVKFVYSRFPYFQEIYNIIQSCILENDSQYLTDYNVSIIKAFMDYLHITTKVIIASKDLPQFETHSSELLSDICENLSATTYIAGSGSSSYMEDGYFWEKNIKIERDYYDVNNSNHIYNQKNSSTFIPYLSILDLCMNVSQEEAYRIVTDREEWK